MFRKLAFVAGFIAFLLSTMQGALADDREGDRGLLASPSLSDYGFERRFVDSPVGRMAVYEAGEGQPLLLLHGVGAGASSFLWFRVAPSLATQYRVIAPDFVGWGFSDRLDRPIQFDDYVAQIEFLGGQIGEPAHVVVQSLASGFTIEAINRGGLEVERLILNGPSGGKDFGRDAFPPGSTEQLMRMVSGPDGGKAFYEQAFLTSGVVRDWYERTGFTRADAVPEELVASSERVAEEPNSHYSALPFLSGTLRYDIAPLLRSVGVPAMMIWGEEEIQIAPDTVRQLIEVNPSIEVVKIPGTRSCFEVEDPEATLALIREFLGRSV
jgi:pimeloyl-ACP methyl ester carboxylesterase